MELQDVIRTRRMVRAFTDEPVRAEQVDRMLSWLHRGPPSARVTEVAHKQNHTERHFDNFQQI